MKPSEIGIEPLIQRMVLIVGKYCMEKNSLFDELEDRFRSNPPKLHYYLLATLFLKVRVHYLNEVLSANNGCRQKETHEMHFVGVRVIDC